MASASPSFAPVVEVLDRLCGRGRVAHNEGRDDGNVGERDAGFGG
jgi:hypothetical protein